MRRALPVLVCGLAVSLAGCGGSVTTPKVDKALEEQQNKSQKRADAEEKEMMRQQKK